MQSFVKAAVLLATLQGVLALPTELAKGEVTAREVDFYLPSQWSAPTSGPISATGANGGYNYGGNGANGGSIDVSRFQGSGAVNANGANGGQNMYGNGANGGRISVNRRDGDFFYPPQQWYRPSSSSANGAISANGANGGYNYGGNGANGGTIAINRREDESGEVSDFSFRPWYKRGTTENGAINGRSDDFFIPLRPWYPGAANYPTNGAISASGANGGQNYYGNGANGGSISVNRREYETDASFPFGRWNRPVPQANGPITATGANGGYNYGGDGANGGSISISGQ